MGKSRNLVKKIRGTNGTFHTKMGTIKDRNGMDLQKQKILRKTARIHRRTIQKKLHDPGNHDGVVTHLEPDVLVCEVRWALGSITLNEVR